MEGRILGEPIIRRSQRNMRQENIPSNIFTPRTYQVELLDTALQRNTIVCLGTGSGKTFIGVMLIREMAHQVRVPFKDGGKRTVFLVNTVPLVSQQAAVVRLHTDLSVAEYTGEMDVDLWSSGQWEEQFTQHQVLVMTSQIFVDILHHGFLGLSRVNLIVFDECHHAVKGHPYVQAMKCYDTCPLESHPRVLGLTASVLNNKCKTPTELEENLAQLELVLHCKAETASDMSIHDVHAAKPKEAIMECDTYNDQTGLIKQFDGFLQPTLDFVGDCNISFDPEEGEKDPCTVPRSVLQECQYILHTLGPWCAGKVAQSLVKQLTVLEEHESDGTARRFLRLALTQLRQIDHIMDRVYDNQVMCLEDFMLYMSPKVNRLVEILHDYKPEDNFVIIGGDDDMGLDGAGSSDGEDGDDGGDDDSLLSDEEYNDDDPRGLKGDSRDPRFHYVAVKRKLCGDGEEEPKDDESLCGIVFCERRHTVFALNKLIIELCNWDPDLFFVQSHHITGHGLHRLRQADMIFKKQEEILRKFRQREINLLVSTSVLEEGVDVPKCNLVVRFDQPVDYRSYVQSKGRARAANSKYFMLVDKADMEKFQEDLKIFKGFENILLNKYAEDQSGDEIENALMEDLLPPYMPLKEDGSPRVTLGSAISLVNRYCAKLPSDAFTHLTPRCTVTQIEASDPPQYVATLQLPINSPIKYPIKGEVMSSKKLAKRAVALKTCETLHKAGELDDHLLPVGKEMIKYDDEENEWEEAEALGQARPGTTKRKQYYFKKVAEPLLGQVKASQPCYMYNINLSLTCPITEEQNTRGRKIYAPEDSPRGFALLCECWIPPVPKFPVFTRSGEVTVSVDLISKVMTFTQEELSRMIEFHHFVFSQVLRLEKEPMRFDQGHSECGYIIVPLNNGADSEEGSVIDWEFIEQIEKAPLKPSNRKYINEEGGKEEFLFRSEDFENAVVMPSYRNIDQPQYFYVAEIRHDLHPRCSFPSPELYDTFEHYYNSKYGLKITSLKQPLLDVDHTSARLNLLTPRYMNQKGVALPTSSAETRKARRENLQQKQILIPELCDVHPFPASLWRKAVCLPAILYRMNYLLIAEELRLLIAREARIGVVEVPLDFRFPELEFGFSTKPAAAQTSSSEGSRKGSDSSAEMASHTEDQPDEPMAAEAAGDSKPEGEEAPSQTSVETVQNPAESEAQLPDSGDLNNTNISSNIPEESIPISEPADEAKNDVDSTQIKDATDAEELSKVVKKPEFALMNGIIGDTAKNTLKQSESDDGMPDLKDLSISEASPDVGGHTGEPKTDASLAGCEVRDPVGTGSTVQDTVILPQPATESTPATAGDNCDITDPIGASQDSSATATTSTGAGETGETVVVNPRDDTYHDTVDDTADPATSDDDDDDDDDVDECTQPGETQVINPSDRDTEKNGEEAEQNYATFIEFDHEEDLKTYIGPSPCTILQTLTMSNANDFFNLERLETIGDSFLKFAITVYLYCTYPGIHEGKLSYLRSKQVSNYNLYKLGKKKCLPDCMIAAKFEPTENWLPPGYVVREEGAFKGLNVYIASKRGRGKMMHTVTADTQKDQGLIAAEEAPLKDQGLIAAEETPLKDQGLIAAEEAPLKDQGLIAAEEASLKDQPQTAGDQTAAESSNEHVDSQPDEVTGGSTDLNSDSQEAGKENEVSAEDHLAAAVSTNESEDSQPDEVTGGSTDSNSKSQEAGKENEVSAEAPAAAAAVSTNENEESQPDEVTGGSTDLNSKSQEEGKENKVSFPNTEQLKFNKELEECMKSEEDRLEVTPEQKCLIPYNLQTQHSLPDKSIADCVEALIGCYLVACGQTAALQLMSWLGLKVLPEHNQRTQDRSPEVEVTPETETSQGHIKYKPPGFGLLHAPLSPLLAHVPGAARICTFYLNGYEDFERRIQYTFQDKSYLLQAFTHASYHYNTVTDCYQRLEFLGDAILDYVITRHLFEDRRKHSPGILTDLRSALVNNNIFAALAVKWDFHKYFKAISPQLFSVIDKFVAWQKDRKDEINLDEEFGDDDAKDEEGEDIEIPKALGDIFESVAGAIYLDSNMSLDTVWKVYYRMMQPQIDAFTEKIPKSPVRELLEMEPETAKFEKPERTLGGKIRVTVNVVGKGNFKGVGRNYRIAKSAAAKRALKYIRAYNIEVEKFERKQQAMMMAVHGIF